MKILVLPSSHPKATELIENLKLNSHDVWAADSKPTENKVRNFVKVNPINFEALTLAFKIANPQEIHYFSEPSLLRNMHVILAAVRSEKITIYYQEDSPIIDTLAKTISKEFKFSYVNKRI